MCSPAFSQTGGRWSRRRGLAPEGLRRCLACAAVIGARFVADDAAPAIERDSAALVQRRVQVQASKLDAALHSGHREPKPLGGPHLGDALELDELQSLLVSGPQTADESFKQVLSSCNALSSATSSAA